MCGGLHEAVWTLGDSLQRWSCRGCCGQVFGLLSCSSSYVIANTNIFDKQLVDVSVRYIYVFT